MSNGNRPIDMCALCDRPIDLRIRGHAGLHLYLGAGWVHGGGRESIPIHHGCAWLGELTEEAPVRQDIIAAIFGSLATDTGTLPTREPGMRTAVAM